MRILFSLDKFTTRDGGADRLARGAVRALCDTGHTVLVLEPGNASTERMEGSAVVRTAPMPAPGVIRDTDWLTLVQNEYWQKPVTEAIVAFRPDLILTQNMLAPSAIAAARACGVRSAILFHGHRCMSPTFFYREDALTAAEPSFFSMPWRIRFKWPVVRRTMALYRKAYTDADGVIANSRYSAQALERFFNRDCPVLYPLLDMHYERVPAVCSAGASQRILFVKPQRNKGVEILERVAPLLPEHEFHVIGKATRGAQRRFRTMPNVTLAGWVNDMESVFRSSRLIFGPSQNPEPFGKVFVEAAWRGIPAVCSIPGGLAEAVGQGGVLLPIWAQPAEWAGAIRSLFEPGRHTACAEEARANAQRLIKETTPQRFSQLLMQPPARKDS